MSGDAPLEGLGVLCTRPSGRGESLHVKLRALGAQVLSIPVLQIVPLEPDPKMRGAFQRLDEFSVVVWVSPVAVELGCELLRDWWPQWPLGVQWLAVGAATAAVLRSYGIEAQDPTLIGKTQNSEGVLQLPALQACAGQRILLIKGGAGRDHLRQTLVERGAEVEEWALYRRVQAAHGDAELQQALDQCRIDAALGFSGETLHHLTEMAGRSKNRLDLIPLFVPGARVAEIARQLGFQNVTSVSGTDDKLMLEALQERFGASSS